MQPGERPVQMSCDESSPGQRAVVPRLQSPVLSEGGPGSPAGTGRRKVGEGTAGQLFLEVSPAGEGRCRVEAGRSSETGKGVFLGFDERGLAVADEEGGRG